MRRHISQAVFLWLIVGLLISLAWCYWRQDSPLAELVAALLLSTLVISIGIWAIERNAPFCPSCGRAVSCWSVYCGNCGHALRDQESARQPSERPLSVISIDQQTTLCRVGNIIEGISLVLLLGANKVARGTFRHWFDGGGWVPFFLLVYLGFWVGYKGNKCPRCGGQIERHTAINGKPYIPWTLPSFCESCGANLQAASMPSN